MPSNSDKPFGHDTLKVRAVFVPEDSEHQLTKTSVMSDLSFDPVQISAVFVPEGGAPPGYPYEHVGAAEFRPDDDGSPLQSTGRPPARQAPEQERQRPRAAVTPPTPSVALRQGAQMAAWRGMAAVARALRGSKAASAPAPDTPGDAADTEADRSDPSASGSDPEAT